MSDKPVPSWPGTGLPGALRGMHLPAGPYVLVVSGSPQRTCAALLAALARDSSAVMAVDSGVAACRAADVVPDRIVGDLDSASADDVAWLAQLDVDVDEHPWEKDETDLALALSAAREMCEWSDDNPYVIVTSACGGRLDHQLAAVGEIAQAADLSPLVVEDGMLAAILDPRGRGALDLADLGLVRNATVSLVALAPGTRASARGLAWELDDAPLEPLSGLGVSNLVADPAAARVEVHAGLLAVIVPRGGDVG